MHQPDVPPARLRYARRAVLAALLAVNRDVPAVPGKVQREPFGESLEAAMARGDAPRAENAECAMGVRCQKGSLAKSIG
jgi:hypothetical protein